MLYTRRMRGVCITMLAAVLLAGCWMSQSEGEAMQTAAQARDKRIAELAAQSRTNWAELDAKVAELESLLERATKVLTRDSADVGADVERMSEQLASLEGQLSEVKHSIELMQRENASQRAELDQRIGRLSKGDAALSDADIPADKGSHFAAAYQAYEQGEHEKARALFREYLKRYGKDKKAGNAQYWIGSSYLLQDKPATALGEYRKVISQHGKSSAVDVALYGMADAFFRLQACGDAKSALSALLKRKPKKSLADRAKKLLRDVKRAGKARCTS